MPGLKTMMAIGVGLLLGGMPAAEGTAGAEEKPFSHDDWATVLERYVDDAGLVDYRGLAQDRAAFDRYLKRVRRVSPETHPQLFPDGDHEFAYYLNAYNALTFDGVLDRGPEEESVWSGLISGYNFFTRMKIVVGGEETNLSDLENEVIRKRFRDARLHAALNCASIGCPRLPRDPFLAEGLDEQLDAAMREFANTSRHVSVDREGRRVTMNKIFDWFREDFIADEKRLGNDSPNLIDYLNRFRSAEDRIPRDYRVEFAPYDKGINKQ